MTILHIVISTPPTSGVAVYAAEFAAAQAEAGHDVEIVTWWDNEYRLSGKVRHKVVKSFKSFDAKPDIVYIHAVLTVYMLKAMAWCKKKNIPYIVYPHGGLMPRVFTKGRLKKTLYWHIFLKPLMKSAKAIGCTSEVEAAACKALGLEGPFIIAPPGVKIPQMDDWHARRKKTVLFMGRLSEEKGLVNLLAAWGKVEHNGWVLKLAGPDCGGYRNLLTGKINRERIDDVVFTGEVDGEMKDSLYREASLFVLPSPMENFSFAVLEALSYGVPVIASKGTPWEALVERKCGWWIEPDVPSIAAALQNAMAKDVADLERCGNSGRELARLDYSWKVPSAENDVHSKKSVLFQLGRCGVGGTERVTVTMANELHARGWKVAVSLFEIENSALLEKLDKGVVVVELDKGWLSAENRAKLRRVIVERDISVIVNQWSAPYKVTRFLKQASCGCGVKLVSFNHIVPNLSKRIMEARNPLVRSLYKFVFAVHSRLVHDKSDAYVVLSKSFIPEFAKFIGVGNSTKIHAVTNPLTSEPAPVVEKENVILYVGRLDETQKRVSRILDAWEVLSRDRDGWRLVIVGDGPDGEKYKARAESLPRVEFVGFADPQPWYAKAKMLLLTSEYEGFGLVLVEAMASRCVPVALGSYPTVREIISEGSGTIVPMPFEVEVFSDAVKAYMDAESLLERTASQAVKASEKFSPPAIAEEYERLFQMI